MRDDVVKWNDIEKGQTPPVRKDVLGFDVFYGDFYVCSWDGEDRTDEELPFLSTGRGDDYWIRFWTELPKPPSKRIY